LPICATLCYTKGMIVTPQLLWEGYDRHKLPLNISVISTVEMPECILSNLYFNGEKTLDGVVRIFAKFYKATNIYAARRSAIVVFDDIENGVDGFDAAPYIAQGYSVLVVDYAGVTDFKSRFTLYPPSLDNANFFLYPEKLEDCQEPNKTCWYAWGCVAMRSITFLESHSFSHIFALGFGHGGEHIYKLCYFDNTVKAGATVFSGGLVNPSTAFLASLHASAYTQNLKSPIFMQVTSNEQNGLLDNMNEVFDTADEGRIYLSIVEHANRVIDANRALNPLAFFNTFIEDQILPLPPVIKPKGSQSKLYYDIKVFNPELVQDITFYVAHATENSAFRSWRNTPLQMLGEGEYLAHVPVLLENEPLFTFVNVHYKNGLIFSSYIEEVIPKTLGAVAIELQRKRLIYDSDNGLSEWMIPNNVSASKLSMQNGPFELEGISSEVHRLITFRLADPQYRGPEDATLQLMLYSPQKQNITFTIQSSQNLACFECVKEVVSNHQWVKLTLTTKDFKGSTGHLSRWDDVLTFEIGGEDTYLINSVLWV